MNTLKYVLKKIGYISPSEVRCGDRCIHCDDSIDDARMEYLCTRETDLFFPVDYMGQCKYFEGYKDFTNN